MNTVMKSLMNSLMKDSTMFRSLSAALFVVVVNAGCATLQMDVPEHFLVIEEYGDSLKALTPDESKIWVRDFNDDTRGSLTFWRDAVKGDLLKGRGYTLIEETSVKDGLGNDGVALVVETTLSGRPIKELMAVFIVPGWFSNRIRVTEFVADKAAFDAEIAGVKTALSTLR